MVCTDNLSSARFRAEKEKPIGKEANEAAWYYPEPLTDKAAPIKDHVAFCKRSEVSRKRGYADG